MSAHTKGPWRFLEAGDTENEWNAGRPLTICDATDNDIANVYSSDDATVTVPREQAIANANLIAAAPDLLEALMDLVDVQPYAIGWDNGVTDSTGTINEGDHWHGCAMDAACAAIRKAQGVAP